MWYTTAFDVSLYTHYVEICSKFKVLDLSDIKLWYAQTFILRSFGIWLRVVCRWILLRRNLLQSSSRERLRQHVPPRWRCLCTRLRGVITQPASLSPYTVMKTWSFKGIDIHDEPIWRREDKEFKVSPTTFVACLIRTKIKLARQDFVYNPDMRVCEVETRLSGFRSKTCGQNQGRTSTYFINFIA